MKEFIKLIKNGLNDTGLSMRELARRSGLDVSFLSKILNGKRNPPSSEKDIRKIARILELDPGKLVFAAGKIPAEFQEIFNDEQIVNRIMEMKNPSARKKKSAADKKMNPKLLMEEYKGGARSDDKPD